MSHEARADRRLDLVDEGRLGAAPGAVVQGELRARAPPAAGSSTSRV